MLSEVVPQIAAFFEDASAVWVATLEVEFDSLGFWVLDSDSLVPLLRNALEGLMLVAARVSNSF